MIEQYISAEERVIRDEGMTEAVVAAVAAGNSVGEAAKAELLLAEERATTYITPTSLVEDDDGLLVGANFPLGYKHREQAMRTLGRVVGLRAAGILPAVSELE